VSLWFSWCAPVIDLCLEICEGRRRKVYAGVTDILCVLASCGSFVERRRREVLVVVVESGLYTFFPESVDSLTYDSTSAHGTCTRVDHLGPLSLGTGKRHRFPKIGIHKALVYGEIKTVHRSIIPARKLSWCDVLEF